MNTSLRNRLLITTSTLILATTLQAATYNVSGGNVTELKNAINSANASSVDDVINLASNSNYTLSSVDNTSTNYGPNGLPVIGKGYPAYGSGKLTINGNGATIQRSNNAAAFRIFQTAQDTEFEIKNLTVKNGKNPKSGGGIFIRERNIFTVDSCTIENNEVTTEEAFGGGGGIHYKHLTEGTITDSTFKNNSSAGCGGGLHVQLSNLTMSGCTFIGNSSAVQLQHAAGGGAVFIDGAAGDNGYVNIDNCSFEDNTAIHQGGAFFWQSYNGNVGTLTNSTFKNNSITGNQGWKNEGLGGAIFVISEAISNSEIGYNSNRDDGSTLIDGCLFDSNRAYLQGGAIWKGGEHTHEIYNSTFYNNRALDTAQVGLAGAIMMLGGTSNLIEHCTFKNNHAGFEAGAVRSEYNTVTVNFSIFDNNTANNPWGTKQDVCNTGGGGGTSTDPAFKGSSNLQYPAPTGGQYSASVTNGPLLTSNPNLQGLSNQGGATLVLPILSNSPAVNAANGSDQIFDQRGYDRDNNPDLGAFEYGATGGGNNDSYESWIAFYHSGGDAAQTSDPDKDGVANLIEYAFGMNPCEADACASEDNSIGLPISMIHQSGNNKYLRVQYTTVKPIPSDITVHVKVANSPNASSWSTLSPISTVDNGNGTQTITVQDSNTMATTPRFMKIEVTK